MSRLVSGLALLLLCVLIVGVWSYPFDFKLRICAGRCRQTKMCPLIEITNNSCPDSCKTNRECGKRKLCCPGECGARCMEGVPRTGLSVARCTKDCMRRGRRQKPRGSCPFVDPTMDWTGSFTCRNQCLVDDHCPGNMLCCDRGCGKRCMKPEASTARCVSEGIPYREGQDVPSEDGSECTCKGGRVICQPVEEIPEMDA